MSFIKYLERLHRMDRLIRLKATGNPIIFSQKIGVSRSVLLEHLREMKELGAPIAYCRFKQSYYYTAQCNLNIEFSLDLKTINGGSYRCYN